MMLDLCPGLVGRWCCMFLLFFALLPTDRFMLLFGALPYRTFYFRPTRERGTVTE